MNEPQGIDDRKIFETGRLGHELKWEDIQHLIVKCSNCQAPLAEIAITRPQVDSSYKLLFNCDHCGDKAFPVMVKGEFHLGATDYTCSASYDEIPNPDPNVVMVLIETLKLKEWSNK